MKCKIRTSKENLYEAACRRSFKFGLDTCQSGRLPAASYKAYAFSSYGIAVWVLKYKMKCKIRISKENLYEAG